MNEISRYDVSEHLSRLSVSQIPVGESYETY